MKQPLVSIKWFGWSLLLILLFASMVVPVQADQALTAMSKDESPHQTKLILKLTEMPAFELRHSGQRVDLEIQNAGVAPSLHSLPEDQSIVKVMLAKKHDALLISYLLRRLPQQVVAESKDNPPRIELNIYWEQGSEGARPGVAFRIADLPPRKAGPGVAKSLLRSPWEDDWLAFFEEYRSLWTLDLPLTYTLPSLPQLISDEQSVLWPLQDFANRGMFLSLLQEATALSDLADEELYLRDVIVAEAQLRTDALEAATARLDSVARSGRFPTGPCRIFDSLRTGSCRSAARRSIDTRWPAPPARGTGSFPAALSAALRGNLSGLKAGQGGSRAPR